MTSLSVLPMVILIGERSTLDLRPSRSGFWSCDPPTPAAGWSIAVIKNLSAFRLLCCLRRNPGSNIRHVFRCTALAVLPEQLQAYDASTARDRHTALIREFLGVTAYGPAARELVVETCLQAARTRDDLPDLINMAIEELIRQRFELPAFSTLLRIARTTRNTVNRRYQSRFCESLSEAVRQRLLIITSRINGESRSLWERIKHEPKQSTAPQMKDFLDHLG